jgi:hypothetical protein
MKLAGMWKRPGRVARGLLCALVACGTAAMTGAQMGAGPVKKAASPHDKSDPWFEARSVCLFRLGTGPMPQSADELSAALQRGWAQNIHFPDPASVVSMEQPGFPTIGALRLNLTDGQVKIVRQGEKKDRIKLNNQVEKELQVGKLEVHGDPLLVRKAKIRMNLDASSAQLVLERDRVGRPVMMLQDANSGTLSFQVSVADAESLMLKSAREAAADYGITVESMELKITAETPRNLRVYLHVATLVGFVPAGMTFKARCDVDDGMNAKISGLSIEGDEALGPLISTLLRPQIVKHNGETRPLVGFPAGKIQLKNVAVRVDDSLHLDAAFGT